MSGETASGAPARTVRSQCEMLGEALRTRGWRIATAESCTGGLLAGALTDIPGSSTWFEYGLVTYANVAKQRLLDIDARLLETEGAVSRAVVEAMAESVRRLADAEIGVSVSGVAGPGGGRPDKPVGTVWIGWALPGQPVRADCFHFDGGRAAVRHQSVLEALRGTMAGLSRELAE